MSCLFRHDADLGCHQGLLSICGKALKWSLSSQAEPSPYSLLQFWSIPKLDVSINTATFNITCPWLVLLTICSHCGSPCRPFWGVSAALRRQEKTGNLRKVYTQSRQRGQYRSWLPLLSVLEEGLGSLRSQDPGDCSNSLALCPGKDLFCGLMESMVEKAFHKMVFTVFGKIHPLARWIRSNIFSRSVHMFWDTLAKPSPEMSIC